MEIRLATPGDVPALSRLYEAFFACNAALQPEYYRAGQESGAYPQSVIEAANAELFVAAEAGELLGFLHIRQAHTPPYDAFVPHPYAEVVDLFVAALHRKKGLATKLMDAARQWARARSLDYMELLVLPGAEDAARFYEQGGFAVAARTMRLSLN